MKYLLAIILQLSVVNSAEACHHYSQWHYPKPQSCGLTKHVRKLLDPPSLLDHNWYVEITKVPPTERDNAIQKLKEQMK